MMFRTTEWGYEGYSGEGTQRCAGVGVMVEGFHPHARKLGLCQCGRMRYIEGEIKTDLDIRFCAPCALKKKAREMAAKAMVAKVVAAKEAAKKKTEMEKRRAEAEKKAKKKKAKKKKK